MIRDERSRHGGLRRLVSFLPGFHPRAPKRNIVVAIAYLYLLLVVLGALLTLGSIAHFHVAPSI